MKLRVSLFAMSCVFALILVVMLALSGDDKNLIYAQNFVWILLLAFANGLFMLGLVVIEIYQYFKLRKKYHRGNSLLIRVGALLLGVSVLPLLISYQITTGLFDRYLRSWYVTPLNEFFTEGIDLARASIGNDINRAERESYAVAEVLSRRRISENLLQQFYRNYNLAEINVFDQFGNAMIGVSELEEQRTRRLPQSSLTSALERGVDTQIVDWAELGKIIRVIRPIPIVAQIGAIEEPAQSYVQMGWRIPALVASSISRLERGFLEYGRLTALNESVNFSIRLLLLLCLGYLLLAAVWLAAVGANIFISPIRQLSKATRQIIEGNFTYRVIAHRTDEIGALAKDFNQMIYDLGRAKNASQQRENEKNIINAYLESILANLTIGVMIVSQDRVLERVNAAASSFFKLRLENLVGKKVDQWLDGLSDELRLPIQDALAQGYSGEFEQSFRLGASTLFLKTVPLMLGVKNWGVIIAIDDITEQIHAERKSTWEEASRRFAHEINNPLTPIRLTAERMLHKNSEGRNNTEKLVASMQLIIKQVDAMRTMVERFRNFEDNSAPILRDIIDPNELIYDVAGLYADDKQQIILDLATNLSNIKGDKVVLRQALHNLIKNSFEAGKGEVQIKINTKEKDNRIIIEFYDNAGGIPEDILPVIFDTDVSTKVEGMGLGLNIVRRKLREHGGTISVENIEGGVKFIIIIPVWQAKRPS